VGVDGRNEGGKKGNHYKFLADSTKLPEQRNSFSARQKR